MTPDDLRTAPSVPGRGAAIDALWWAARPDWTRAHEVAQADENNPDAAWVHAYLHRVEGDMENARYWYERAGKPVTTAPLDVEWMTIAATLLSVHPEAG